MAILRTPDERFENLEGWSYPPRYVNVDGDLRMHYVDVGPGDARPVLLAHGEPTWGYLYRKMIPGLVDAGFRVIAPDLVGFGRSDKPGERGDYSYENHVRWTGALLDALDLGDITLFGQDWGGLVFLVHVGVQPERFRAVVASNTALPSKKMFEMMPEAIAAQGVAPFLAWRRWADERAELLPSEAVGGDSPLNQVGHRLTPGEAAAYDAPFPDESYRTGARMFPHLVPLGADDPAMPMLREAWRGLVRFERPFVTAFADREDITAPYEIMFQTSIPGAAGRRHHKVANAGHFVQEHAPETLVEIIADTASAEASS